MIFSALNEAAERGGLLLVKDGFCRFYRRKRDNVIVIREIIVLPRSRRMGIASLMVKEIQLKFPKSEVLARCPVGYESNLFWGKMGFRLEEEIRGVNVWKSN